MNFLEALVRHHFVLCPPGNGVDTHRMWEVLLAGVIFGVKKSIVMESFNDLLISFVEGFRGVTKELLEKTLREIQIPGDRPAMMRESYWAARIDHQQSLLERTSPMSWKERVSESSVYRVSMISGRFANP